MMRFRRWVWGSIATISFLLCVGTISLLVRSEFKVYVWEWLRRSPSAATWNLIQIVIGHDKIALNIISGPAKPYRGVQIFQFPLLFPALLFAAVAIMALGRYRRMRKHMINQRIRDGVCTRCGYDLRATPDRCPECATIPPKKEAVSLGWGKRWP
jgi:hypothetical protein